jgi:DUF4097 and DUF4098 domain-containing protein YvlB
MFRVLVLTFALAVAMAGCINASNDNDNKAGDHAPTINADITADSNGAHAVNGSIRVPAGVNSADVSTVNGSIVVDDNATLTEAHTVNGSIGVGAHATAKSLTTVNGSVTLGDGAKVEQAVSSVNGGLTLHSGSDVSGILANVNGHIDVAGGHVGGGIKTVNGDINIGANSRVEGGIRVEKPSESFFNFGFTEHQPRIVIGPGAIVQGDLRFERAVKLYVSDRATIGTVSGATPVKFSGDNPPG